MLESMHGGIIHIVPRVWLSGTEVVGHYSSVHAGDIDPLREGIVVYRKALNWLLDTI